MGRPPGRTDMNPASALPESDDESSAQKTIVKDDGKKHVAFGITEYFAYPVEEGADVYGSSQPSGSMAPIKGGSTTLQDPSQSTIISRRSLYQSNNSR